MSGLFSIFDVAGSAMSVQSLRLNTTASNMANAETISGTEATAYRSRQPVFKAMLDKMHPEAPVGVQFQGVVESQAPVRIRYAPGNPLADENGNIFTSNVDMNEEMVNMISASRSFQNNVEIMNTSKELLMRTLSLGQ